MMQSIYVCFSWVCVFYLLLFVSNGVAQWSVDDSGCRTPDRATGDCILISKCQHMLNLLKSLQRPISPAINHKIRAYTCGYQDNAVKVCCPPNPINLGSGPGLFHERSQPPDVTNHRNINLLPETCGIFDTTSKIVNGNDTMLNEFPWMALLQYKILKKNNKLDFLCGGTIIHKNYILTAAHCLEKSSQKQLVGVRVGEYSINNDTDCERVEKKKIKCNPPVQDLAVEEIIIHPQYGSIEGGYVNDIGLIRVSTINLDLESARPVCLPVGVVRDWKYKSGLVTGWGVVNVWTGKTADILQKVLLPVADRSKCIEVYKESGINITNTQICVGGVDRDSCGGDSGGPLQVPTPVGNNYNLVYIQQGVVSFGPRYCANPKYPGVYTAVKFYMDWILDSIRE